MNGPAITFTVSIQLVTNLPPVGYTVYSAPAENIFT